MPSEAQKPRHYPKDRRAVLLRAARDMLREEAVHIDAYAYYDDDDFDAYCLADDIEAELGIDAAEPMLTGPRDI